MKPYTTTDIKTVQNNIHLTDKEISKMIGHPEKSLSVFRRNVVGIKKLRGYSNGHRPWNKGIKIEHGGTYKHGHTPVSKRAIGDIFTKQRKGVAIRTYIVTEENPVYPYQRYLLEQHLQQKIPAGLIVSFIDKNPQNFEISNLEIVTRRELGNKNLNRKKANETKGKRLQVMKEELATYGIKGITAEP